MRKYLLTALLVFAASNAFAIIAGSKHDLSSGGGSASKGTSDQICKYCHVPHNAVNPKALWSRNNNATAVTVLYTNPGSLDAVPLTPSATQSTACLACHNVTPSTGSDASTNLGANITGNAIINEATTGLSNDHPIAFKYDTALVNADKVTNSNVAGLYTPDTVNTVGNGAGNKLPLYGTTGTLECASCHAVHGVDVAGTNIPMFLRTTAKGSAICLKCHIK